MIIYSLNFEMGFRGEIPLRVNGQANQTVQIHLGFIISFGSHFQLLLSCKTELLHWTKIRGGEPTSLNLPKQRYAIGCVVLNVYS